MSARKGSAGRPVVAAVSPVAPVLGGRSVSFGGDGAALGIAMGWVRQRARMARAREVVDRWGFCSVATDLLDCSLSPEHAVCLGAVPAIDSASHVAAELARNDLLSSGHAPPVDHNTLGHEVAAIIESPEWAALWEGL